jgi:hypothetical protein
MVKLVLILKKNWRASRLWGHTIHFRPRAPYPQSYTTAQHGLNTKFTCYHFSCSEHFPSLDYTCNQGNEMRRNDVHRNHVSQKKKLKYNFFLQFCWILAVYTVMYNTFGSVAHSKPKNVQKITKALVCG